MSIVDIVQSLGIIATLGFAIYQFANDRKVVKAKVSIDISKQLLEINSLFCEKYPELEEYRRAIPERLTDMDSPPDIYEEKPSLLIDRFITLLYGVYQQYKEFNLAEEKDWEICYHRFQEFVNVNDLYFYFYWLRIKTFYPQKFRELLDDITKKLDERYAKEREEFEELWNR
jgi:hypothetical protein